MTKKRSGTTGKTQTIAAKGFGSTEASSAGRAAAVKRASGTIRGRPSAVGKMSIGRLPGPTPGRRTISDEAIREIVRDVIRKRTASIDA